MSCRTRSMVETGRKIASVLKFATIRVVRGRLMHARSRQAS